MEAIEEKPKSSRLPLSTVTEQSDALHRTTKSTKPTKDLLKSDNNLSNL